MRVWWQKMTGGDSFVSSRGFSNLHFRAHFDFPETVSPRTRVDHSEDHPEFIAGSSPCVSLPGMSALRLDEVSSKVSHHQGRPKRIVLSLSAQGSILVLFLAFGWWGIMTLGSHSLASQTDSLGAMGEPVYVAGCPVAASTPETSSAGGGVGKKNDGGWSEEGLYHSVTSRRPGAGPSGHAYGAEAGGGALSSERTSENKPSTHSGE